MKKALALLLAIVMAVGLLSMGVSAASVEGNFTDISDKYYAHMIEELAKAGIMLGVGNGKFNPDGNTTRAMAVTVLGRMAKVTETATDKFTDVPTNAYYAGYVGWAAENGIVIGDGDGHFMPDKAVTGYEMDLMLSRYAELNGIRYTASITSKESLTRGELAVMIYYIWTKPATPSDLPGEPVWGTNPEYEVWTVVMHEDQGSVIPVTISANTDLTQFEVLFTLGEDHKMIATRSSDGNIEITHATVPMFGPFAIPLIEEALTQNIWRPVSECTVEYVDPEAQDKGPLCVQTGAYDAEFERTNENLNGLLDHVADEKILEYKMTPVADEDKGTVEMIEYTTGGNTAYAYVYLPASYDSAKQYSVLYLLHGGGGNAASWFTSKNEDDAGFKDGDDITGSLGYAVNLLDNVFANGDANPCIIVTPNATDVEGFAVAFRDLMAKVDETYPTIADRDHRAMAGLSMGSIATWYGGIIGNLDNLSWFANMSGGPVADVDGAAKAIEESVIPALESAAAKGNKVNMMMNFNGVHDVALAPHVAAHKQLVEYADGSDVLTVGENYDFLSSDGAHDWTTWQLYLYDVLQIIFK